VIDEHATTEAYHTMTRTMGINTTDELEDELHQLEDGETAGYSLIQPDRLVEELEDDRRYLPIDEEDEVETALEYFDDSHQSFEAGASLLERDMKPWLYYDRRTASLIAVFTGDEPNIVSAHRTDSYGTGSATSDCDTTTTMQFSLEAYTNRNPVRREVNVGAWTEGDDGTTYSREDAEIRFEGEKGDELVVRTGNFSELPFEAIKSHYSPESIRIEDDESWIRKEYDDHSG